jgi:hypothetical protein
MCRIKVSLGALPTINAMIPKGKRNTEFLLELIGEYLKLVTKE